MAKSFFHSKFILLLLLCVFLISTVDAGRIVKRQKKSDDTKTKTKTKDKNAAAGPLDPVVSPIVNPLLAAAVGEGSTLPGNWESVGCYSDSVASRTLKGSGYASGTAMTTEACINFCITNNYVYAGTEYGQECYCGNSIASSGVAQPAGDCNMNCSGNNNEICGGPNRISLYNDTSAAAPPSTSINPGTPPWAYVGCYTEGTTGRVLTTPGNVAGGMTVNKCTAACSAAGYTHAGVEYAAECWCGNEFSNGGGLAPDGEAQCNMVCSGNSTEFCGGPNRLNMYDRSGTVTASATATSSVTPSSTSASVTASASASATAEWTDLGCYTDGGMRTLAYGMPVTGGMTREKCQAACKTAGYTLAGVEYAAECYCDNTFKNGGGPAPDGNTGCNMACSGDPTQICGGAFRLNVFSYGAATPSGTVTSTTASSTSSVPTPTGIPTGWNYTACYVDNANGRILRQQQPDSSTLTVQSCISQCVAKNYTVAGMEYSTQCFCDNYIINGAVVAQSDSQCGMACGGDATQKCGGPDRMSIYATGTPEVLPVPVNQNSSLPGSWAYQGCLTDNAAGTRTFPYQIIYKDTNSAETCLTQCQKYGFGAGGMEYGEECFCGDVKDVTAAGATIRPDSECNTICPGNGTYYCGAGNRLSYYTWTGEPLENWSTPTGVDAGEYRFLTGGIVIPLISTPARNGKVTFLEKFGTGAINSTGAYEFDISQIDNPSLAWREMHVKTDVFCAAGLTLPDKAGRQITVGGWAGESTTGIRLYWPDGSPGVLGTNDWEENVQELSLQKGRWYPTSMIMANGTILVVGGQVGANGPPVPSLELLPRPPGGPVVYCDYLERTDPYNLYPYLAVLPSGGILVLYYNEARILDEVDFSTTKVLPNIPGAVNNPKGGRTYPLEGTAMLLPQTYPYTDPLGVILCGGTTPFEGAGIDNCVTLYPEQANSTWIIERMPSRRVMSCMVALPDGTYLILNGSLFGEAGFGLGTEPNHSAVLYDPTKTLHSRFSIMANTTISRMYHSEAVLLEDGRVLVSGSDPQDARYPQEYRLEVFMPPYLLSGAARPSFTISNTDWAYSQNVPITITAGSTANIRVSLMGAVSSTHGNSMGQRTIFPQVSCAGSTCTITAPPNAHVCPPGWFMLFVLDGPTPSVAKWVRIGGDPASLGNWPNFPDFNVPGV